VLSLKKFRRKQAILTFDKPFIPTQKLSKFFATNTGSVIKYMFNIFSTYFWVAHVNSCIIQTTKILNIYAFFCLLFVLTNWVIMQKEQFLINSKNLKIIYLISNFLLRYLFTIHHKKQKLLENDFSFYKSQFKQSRKIRLITFLNIFTHHYLYFLI